MVEALTTNETSWFRDAQPFTSLAEHIVPELLAERPPGATLRMWSAACSSGQEPYSIAMALEDLVVARRLQILGTDLNRQMVERTRAGRYSQLEVNRGLPAPMLVRHFARHGAEWEVSATLRSVVTAAQHNLLDAATARRARSTWSSCATSSSTSTWRPSVRCCARCDRAMRPGGWLLLGAAETTIGIDDAWERVSLDRGSVYRLPARRAA